ncbi:MAG: hypothetical protein K6E49_04760 [Lachnospiraceae bacterium]|nr:hypothetical protein [Lachnospiraceae bacterium]
MYKKQYLQQLQDIFDRVTNDTAVLYGSEENGLLEILSDFIKDKDCFYYRAQDVCESVQKELFASELHEQTKFPIFPDVSYEKLLDTYVNDHSEKKKLIVFDGFQFIVRENPTFINFLSNLISERAASGTVMYLLSSDDIDWIENDMIRLTGRKSYEIAGVIKLNDHTPTEMFSLFSDMDQKELMGIYSVIGGKSRYYNGLNDSSTVHDVVISLLNDYYNAPPGAVRFLPKDIREPQLYNSILVHLAAGRGKLNDLYVSTGVERAKLSVYLRTLIKCGIVEKAGTAFYRVKDPMVRFYYRFVYPSLSSLFILGPERFYRKFIEHDLPGYIEDFYPFFCMEHIRWLDSARRLNFKVAAIEEYHDKARVIDFIIVAAGGSVIACACRYAGPHMSFSTYEKVKNSVRKEKLICDNVWLFSASGFDQKLSMFGSVTPGVRLIDGTHVDAD